jgi:hypothetical protein
MPERLSRAGPALTTKPEFAVTLEVPLAEIEGVPQTSPDLAVQNGVVAVPEAIPES